VVTVVLLHTLIVVVAVAGPHRASLGTAGLNSAGLNNAGLNNAGGLRRIRG